MTVQEAEEILRGIPEYSWIVESDQSFWRTGDILQAMGISAGTIIQWCKDGLIDGATNFGGALGWRMPRSGLLLFFAARVKRHRTSQVSG